MTEQRSPETVLGENGGGDDVVSPLIIGVRLRADTADPKTITRRARAAEDAGLQLIIVDDPVGAPSGVADSVALDPIEVASFVGAVTRSIGLVAASAATYAEPYHLSNRLSSLDWGTSGRAGWLATVDTSAGRARAYGAAAADTSDPGSEADAVIDIARRLWDSWEDGALIADSASGRFLDNTKLHYVDAEDDPFRVRGPALMPRPVQGQIPVFAAIDSPISDPDVLLVTDRTTSEAAPASRRFGSASINRSTSAAELAELLRNLADRFDGVIIDSDGVADGSPGDDHLDHLIERLADALPPLIADQLVIPSNPGVTLRDQLRLPRPASRYAAAAEGATS